MTQKPLLYTEADFQEAMDYWTDMIAEAEEVFTLKPDRKAIRAEFEALRETQPKLFEQKYGPEETRRQERAWMRGNP